VLVLASSSVYRQSLLARLRLPFSIAPPHVDESPRAAEAPQDTALRLAEEKARAVAASYTDAFIIGSDQVAALDGELLGKPHNPEAALAQLMAVRGQNVVFHTALCLLRSADGHCAIEDITTRVRFRRYTSEQALRYLEVDQPYDCAGSAKIESLGIALVEHVDSTDPTALIGLPLIALVTMLKRAGIEVL
jgi:septum formation protein